MTQSIYQGDPLLVMSENGVTLNFKGGQPTMTQGFENQVNISLFTNEGWFGNKIIPNVNNQIGSNFLKIANGPLTLSSLSDIEKAAVKALSSEAFGGVESSASNPSGQRLNVINKITPPGSDSQALSITRSFGNWLAQATETR